MGAKRVIRLLVALCLLASQAIAGPHVIDGDTLDLGDIRYRLYGIDAPEVGQICADAAGHDWDCGKAATAALARLVRGGPVTCSAIDRDGYGRVIARCRVAGRDLSETMARAGMAWAFTRYSRDHIDAEAQARSHRRGIWQGEATPAWEFRAARWTTAEQAAPDGCPIKGNITRRGRIYHTPWSSWYARTRINRAKGERWFCDEAEAIAAGWRAPVWN